MSKKQQGATGQLRVAHVYQKIGFNVLFPFGDLQKYDLVVEKDGVFSKIQVKTTSERQGYIYGDTRVIGHDRKGVNIYKPMKDDFDILAIVEMKTQNVYAIPFDGKQRQFHLRTERAKNNQRKGVRFAEEYLMGP